MSVFSELAQTLDDPWLRLARPEQLAPAGEWSVWTYLAGRGAGKSRSGAEWTRTMAQGSRTARIALIGPTAADVRDVMVEGESGILATSPDHFRPIFEPSKRRLTWPNGAVATMFSSEEPERLRGPQHTHIWADELCAWSNAQETWSMAMFGLRLGKHPQVMVSTTPKPTKLLKELVARAGQDVVITRGSTYDNRANLAATFFSQIVKRYEGTRLGRQELNAELLEDVEGALWTRDMIEAARLPADHQPELLRVVVAIDPAVSVSVNSDETGLVVAGVGTDGKGYVLEDLSGKYSPTEWAQRAVNAYRRHRADRIVAEANQGGAMVESTLRVVDPNIPVRLVHASRGKITRAEPISALYEQGRIHHVGGFDQLEDQLCSFEPGSSGSPDRLDALVWALTELMVGAFQSVTSFHAPVAGPGRDAFVAERLVASGGGSLMKPGGWPAGSPQAAAAGGFSHLSWTHKG